MLEGLIRSQSNISLADNFVYSIKKYNSVNKAISDKNSMQKKNKTGRNSMKIAQSDISSSYLFVVVSLK